MFYLWLSVAFSFGCIVGFATCAVLLLQSFGHRAKQQVRQDLPSEPPLPKKNRTMWDLPDPRQKRTPGIDTEFYRSKESG